MEYARLINGKIDKCVIFPNGTAVLNGRMKRNPSHEDFIDAGYLPIEETVEPESRDGFIKSSKWVQTDTAIIKKWTVKRDMSPISHSAISKMLIEQQINTLAVDNNTALRMKSYYPEWAENVAYSVGYKVQRDGKLWQVVQSHTSQAAWKPEDTPSLWEQINETFEGSIYDPIPYDGNMSLENGKYYVQYNVVYLCNRDTVNPVYHNLSELVDVYVEEVGGN